MATQSARLGFKFEVQEKISSDRLALFVFIFFLISVTIQGALIVLNWRTLPPQVPIFYSKPWGEPMLAAPIFLWILPSLTVIFVIVNYFVALYLLRSQYFLNRVLVVFSAIISFSTLYDISRIIGLLV